MEPSLVLDIVGRCSQFSANHDVAPYTPLNKNSLDQATQLRLITLETPVCLRRLFQRSSGDFSESKWGRQSRPDGDNPLSN